MDTNAKAPEGARRVYLHSSDPSRRRPPMNCIYVVLKKSNVPRVQAKLLQGLSLNRAATVKISDDRLWARHNSDMTIFERGDKVNT